MVVEWTKTTSKDDTHDTYRAKMKDVLSNPVLPKFDGLYIRTPIGELPLSQFRIMDVPLQDADGVYRGSYTTEANWSAFRGNRYVLLIMTF